MANQYPTELRYTNDHEWLREESGTCRVGVTQFAIDQLGDITLVELPKEGDLVTKGQRFGTIESVKAVSDLYAPVSGRIIAVNAELKTTPELCNQDVYGKAWMVEIEPTERGEIDELLTHAAYVALVESQ
jgi:glycine cleavage system H protein